MRTTILKNVGNHSQIAAADADEIIKSVAREITEDYEWSMRQREAVVTLVAPYCVDPETQCLTRRGWLSYVDLRADDELLAWDRVTEMTRWEKPREIFVTQYRGPMVELGARTFSALVTPDHRWPVFTRYGGFSVRLTKELGLAGLIPRSARCEDVPTKPKYSDAFVRVVAWYMTEGTRVHYTERLTISQSHLVNPGNVEAIRKDLVEIGARHKPRGGSRPGHARWPGLWVCERIEDDRITRFMLTGTAVDEITAACSGPGKIPAPEFLLALTQEQLEMFLDTCQRGDGTPRDRRFYQYDPERMDAYCMAAVLAGYEPSVDRAGHTCSLNRGRRGRRGERRTYADLGGLPRRFIEYEGPIWCPVLPSSFWVARRRGRVYITGNTTGTVAATLDSEVITGTSTVWVSGMVRRGITIDGADTWFRVVTFTSTTSIKIGDAQGTTVVWPYATGAAKTYSIFQSEYDLGTDVAKVRGMTRDFPLSEVPPEWIDAVDPERVSRGEPIKYALRRTQLDTSGTVQRTFIEFYPVPSANGHLLVPYLAAPPGLGTDSDLPACPSQLIEVLGTSRAADFIYAKTGDARWGVISDRYFKRWQILDERLKADDEARQGLPRYLGGHEGVPVGLDRLSSRDWGEDLADL